MSASDIYYQNQAKARGMDSADTVASFASLYDRIYDSLILEHLPADKTARIYEVACGPGLLQAWLKRRGYSNLSGTDFCESYVKVARDCGLNVELKDSLLDLKDKPDGSVDVIFAIDFVEHLPKDVFLEFLYDARRVLSSGGRLIMRAPNGDSPIVGRNLYNDITHYWAYTSIAFRAILQIVGFSEIVFRDESLAPHPSHLKWLSPFSWVARKVLRATWALATRERIDYLGPNLFVIARR